MSGWVAQSASVSIRVERSPVPVGLLKYPTFAGSMERTEQVLEPPQNGPWRRMEATGYAHGCTMTLSGVEPGRDQLTASGVPLVPNWSVAASREFPFNTVLEISFDGIQTTRIVHDRGREIVGNRIDLAFSDCERARTWGRRFVDVREVRRPLASTGAGK